MFYIPLYIKTEYSLLDSTIKIKELVEFAKANNIKALTITDNNLYGAYEFYLECTKNNIKPIIGLEIEINKLKIILYAKNINGYKNLIKINEEEKNIELIKKYNNDLICILPYNSLELYSNLSEIFKDIFIGYKNINEFNNIKYTNKIYLNEILYLNKNDKIYYLYLKGIKNGVTINEVNVEEYNYLNLEIKENLENYKKIYDSVNIVLEKRKDLLPIYKVEENYTDYTYLKEMCRIGLKKRFGEKVSLIYIERIKHELEVIKEMGFCNYFLVVMDYVKYAKKQNILVGPGRGSAAGSLVAYVLEITEIDPIKYNLLFERFLNKDRITMPDIDIDFEYNRREEVINYCVEKYGIKKVATIVTFGTLAARQAIRDVGRVMNIDIKELDSFTKLIDSKISLKENIKSPKIQNIIDTNKNINELVKVALKLEGLKRHTSIHPAGIVISNKDLDTVLPIIKHENMYMTCFTSNYLEDIGLLKMDFLALKNLTIITNILEDLKKDNINVDFNKIPLNDSKTYEIFKEGNTTGIFQFESEGMKNFLKKLKPDNIEDLSNALALYRPGPMANIDNFIRRKNNLEKIEYIDEKIEKILKSTYGIIIYQEQIMKISNVMASYTMQEADLLRRAMSKKKEDVLLNEKLKFINGCIKNGYDEKTANEIFAMILKFASYGFNRSHSVAYSMISYKMAYLKANYKKYFMKNLLDNVIGTIITKDYIYEAKMNDIKILNPDINKSEKYYKIEADGLRFPFSCIKEVGENIIKKIVETRKEKKYIDIFDFVGRVYDKQVNKEVIITLIDVGCFDSFNINHKTLIENLDLIINYTDLYKELGEYAIKPNLIEYSEYSELELIERSFNKIGFYLSNHPVTEYKAKYKNIVDLNEIKNYFNRIIETAVMIDKIKKIETKNKEEMCFIDCSDEFEQAELVVFPKVLKKYPNLKVGDIIVIKCKVEKRFDKYQLILNEIIN